MDWSIVLDVGVGAGVLLLGIGTLVAMLALAKTLRRVDVTLDEVDRQLAASGKPIGEMLEHVNAISESAEHTLGRLSGVVATLEGAAGSVTDTVSLTKRAVSPAIVNVGAAVTGVSAGLRRLLTGKSSPYES